MKSHKTQEKNKNHVLLLLFVVALFLLSTISVNALARPRLVVSGFDYGNSSSTAAVGSEFNLHINVTNVDVVCAMTTIVSITANEPFIARSTNSALPVDICGDETKTIVIPLRIDSTAVGGSYQLPVSLNFEDTLNTAYSSSDVLTLFVSGTPDIRAHVSSSTPAEISSGDTASLTVTLENAGTFVAQSLNATLTADAPLDVKWTASTATVGTLLAGRTAPVTFSVELPKNAHASSYPMNLHVAYLDEKRAVQTKDIALNLIPKKKATFDVTVSAKSKLYANDDQKVMSTVFKNTGSDTAYNIKVKSQPQYPFTTDGSVRYIKSLAAGESVPLDIVLNVDKDGTVGQYGLDLLIDFEDVNGKVIHDTAKLAVILSPKGLLRAVFIDYWFLWLVALFVTIVVQRKKAQKAKVAAKK